MTDFMQRLAAKRASLGSADWMICPCQEKAENPAGWFVGVVHDIGGPIIGELRCPECDTIHDVLNGRPESEASA